MKAEGRCWIGTEVGMVMRMAEDHLGFDASATMLVKSSTNLTENCQNKLLMRDLSRLGRRALYTLAV